MNKFYNVLAVSLGAFLGGPLAATYFLSKNFRKLEDHNSARKVIRLGALGTLTLLIIIFLLPINVSESLPNFLFPVIFFVIARFIVTKYQQEQMEQQVLDNKAEYESYWKVVGISLICALITFVSAIFIFILTDLLKP